MQANWIRAEVDREMNYLAVINLLTKLDHKIKTIMHYLPVPIWFLFGSQILKNINH